jgi:hypothetical protein
MSIKIYYICKHTFNRCLGANGGKTERIKFYTNKKKCITDLKELRNENKEKNVLYFYDFEWKNWILKEYYFLFKNGFDIGILNRKQYLFCKEIR